MFPSFFGLNTYVHSGYDHRMKTPKLLILALSVFALSFVAHASTEVDRLLAEYAKIDTVACQIRRTKIGGAGKIKFLSRVYWTKKNQLHAEGITPIKRRTIVDQTTLYQYVEGDPKGFSRPIKELSEDMAISLQLVPGTAMDHLLRLKDKDEIALPSHEGFPKRVGVQTEKKYVVLLFDDKDRLSGIEFYETAALKDRIANYRYRDFTEAVPGAWVPLTHEATVGNADMPFKETVKVDRFVANKPIAESLFIPSSFFDKDIDFVDEFTKIFPSERNENAGQPAQN